MKKGDDRSRPPDLWRERNYRFFAFLAFLAAFFAFFAMVSSPPSGWVCVRKVMPRHRGCICRLALSPRVPVTFAPCCALACALCRALWQQSRAEEKVGQCSQETAPLQSGQSYFFFAFLAFLAAFFAFFAIVPPEGV
jgi:hypothetical protein